MSERFDKPHLLVYVAYFGLYAVALNTVYLVLPNDYLRWYLMGALVIAVSTGLVLSSRHYVALGLGLDAAALGVFIYYAYRIYQDPFAFGSHLGEMLSVMLVLRAFKLFNYQDFLLPLVISLTLMVFSAIPSFSATFVYSLLGFLLILGAAMFLGSIDEFARLPRRRVQASRFRYTYGFLEEYTPTPLSKQTPMQLARFLRPALVAGIPAILAAFVLSSAVYFTVDHVHTPGGESPLLSAFGSAGLQPDLGREADLLTGTRTGGSARYYAGFDEDFDIASGRLIENSTSTNTVMTVESNLPSYWRGKCFDTYTGRGWKQSEDTPKATWSLDPPAGQRASYHAEVTIPALAEAGIEPDPRLGRDQIRQKFQLETDLPGIVFTAYQPVELSLPVAAVQIDDTFTLYPPPAADSMVAGQSYEVVSWKHFARGEYLDSFEYDRRDLSRERPEFFDRYTQLPERGTLENPNQGYDFSRVRARAYEVIAGADTVYQRVKALERHLKSNYRYSLNPPAAVPEELDAVEYFLYDWEPRRGHCEYFSTALAVMCRSVGIPARVVSGYATGSYNLLKNCYVVQERHAHAWVEVFWPDLGWIEFDATPQTWYQGIGEKAASGWLVFHDAMENLYVYDPRGYFRDKIFPFLNRVKVSVLYFVNQRELDFFEFVDPILPRTGRGLGNAILILLSATLILVGSVFYRIMADPERDRRLAVRIGYGCLSRVKGQLAARGVDPVRIATEEDCAIQATKLSTDWGSAVKSVVGVYQTARYSGREMTGKEVAAIRQACREARKPPRR